MSGSKFDNNLENTNLNDVYLMYHYVHVQNYI